MRTVGPPLQTLQLDMPLYRGVRGKLPESFWVRDEQDMICCVDLGFMSTTREASGAARSSRGPIPQTLTWPQARPTCEAPPK